MSSRLTAMDIENQDFGRKLRGYDPQEVNLFLQSVAENVERLTLENGELLEELGHLREQHRSASRSPGRPAAISCA